MSEVCTNNAVVHYESKLIYFVFSEEFSLLLILIGIFATIIVILVITLFFLLCRQKISQICSHKEDKPYKPNNINRYYALQLHEYR